MQASSESKSGKWASPDEIRIGVSSCLLGEEVRYNGGHKRDSFLTETVAPFVRFVPVCPEIEVGMGTPREAIRLVRDGEGVRLVGVQSETDHTRAMLSYARRRIVELKAMNLCGYVFKKDSPSCGLFRVRIHDSRGKPDRVGRGLFAAELTSRLPLLPVEEEGRLHDLSLRENFFERVFAYRRLRSFFDRRWTLGGLVRLHSAEKLLLMAHDIPRYRALGRLVADSRQLTRREAARQYQEGFLSALAVLTTTKKHTNVLQHMAGYFKKLLQPKQKAELLEAIDDFRRGLLPLVAPLTLIRHYVRVHRVEYLDGQTYLEPHPKELMLRNHV